jgi:RNA polymerase sigma-70 factor, ECF subfamily
MLEAMPVNDEQHAVLQCRAGDHKAFQMIVERYGDLLFGTAYMMLGDRAVAEEQVQEALISAWQGLGSYDLERPLRPWLLRVLINQVLQHRRRKLFGFIPLGEEATRVPALEDGPDLIAEEIAAREHLRKALAELSQQDYRLIVLRYFGELPLHEIAETVGIPEGTVKSRLSRARSRLRTSLTRSGFSLREEQ